MTRSAVRAFVLTLVLAGLPALPSMADVGPLHYFAVTPCRLADTRNANGVNGGPVLTNGVNRAFQVKNALPCTVPSGAKAVLLNITVTQPQAFGWLALFPSDVAWPGHSNINFVAGDTIANTATVALAPDNVTLDLMVKPAVGATPGTVHVVLDVAGYYK